MDKVRGIVQEHMILSFNYKIVLKFDVVEKH